MLEGDPESMFDEIFNELDNEQGGDSIYLINFLNLIIELTFVIRIHGWISQKSII